MQNVYVLRVSYIAATDFLMGTVTKNIFMAF